jgi:hypothetical protein
MGKIWATHTIYSANGRMIGAILVDEQTCAVMNVSSDQIKETLKNKTGKIENIYLDDNGVLREPNLNPRFPDAEGYYRRIKRTYNNSDKVYTMYLYQIILGVDLSAGTFSVLIGLDGDNCVNRLVNVTFDEYIKTVYGRYTGSEDNVMFLNGVINNEGVINRVPKVKLSYFIKENNQYRLVPLAIRTQIIYKDEPRDIISEVNKVLPQPKKDVVAVSIGNGKVAYRTPSSLKGNEIVIGDTTPLWKLEVSSRNPSVARFASTYKNWGRLETPYGITDILKFNGSVNELVLSDDIRAIRADSFSDLIDLTRVEMNNKIELIDREAFMHDYNLESVKFSPVLETIQDEAFHECQRLRGDYYITASYIGKKAFTATSISKLELPNITKIGSGAFAECKELSVVKLGGSVSMIYEGAFSRCINLQAVKFEGTGDLLSIGNQVFAGCKKLQSIEFPESTSYIGPDVFLGCSSLKRIVVPRKAKWEYPNNKEDFLKAGVIIQEY